MPTSERLPAARVVLALARGETKRILLHPVFLGAVAVCTLFVTRATGRSHSIGFLAGGVAIGVVAGGFLSTNVATLRARRDRVLELFGSLPSPPESRTSALLLGALFGPVMLSVMLTAAGRVLLASNTSLGPYLDLALAAQVPLTMAALGSLAVALGRWIPSLVAAPVVLIAHVMTGIIWVLPWIVPTSTGIRVGWHLAYLVSLVVLWSAVALVRDRRTLTRLVVAGLAVAFAVVAASIQVPPGGLR